MMTPSRRLAAAVAAAIAEHGYTSATPWFRRPAAEAVLLMPRKGEAGSANGLTPCYEVKTWTASSNVLKLTYVNQITGAVVRTDDLTSYDSYLIYPRSPAAGPAVVINGPGRGAKNASSKLGWLKGAQRSRYIVGNNVAAYTDTDANNKPDNITGVPRKDAFLSGANFTRTVSADTNMEVAVQNVFYHGARAVGGRSRRECRVHAKQHNTL